MSPDLLEFDMKTTWTFEGGKLWATGPDGRRNPTWTAESSLGCFVDVLNLYPDLSARLLSACPRQKDASEDKKHTSANNPSLDTDQPAQ